MNPSPVLAILITCRNRRETTLRALRRIAEQPGGFTPRLFVYDDASEDGTPEAVAEAFPDVHIIRGDGTAFWNGGLHRVWTTALASDCDAFLWLNDDVALDDDAFARLRAAWNEMEQRSPAHLFILAGATRGALGEVSYGGKRARHSPVSFWLDSVTPGDALAPIDTFNGNIVLVPRAVVDRIGINDAAFHHNWGDLDYGLRATQAGITAMLLPGTLGACEANAPKKSRGYGSPDLTLFEQWRKVNTHHGTPFASWWRLTRRHSGRWWPLHFLLPYRWLVIPRWVRRLAARS